MRHVSWSSSFAKVLLAGAVSGVTVHAYGQAPSPQPGYFDIPAGFDFPADKQTLEQFRRRLTSPRSASTSGMCLPA
jgi:hypothetical protein